MRSPSRNQLIWGAAAGAGALAAGALTQWRFSRSIAKDPAGQELQDPPSGAPIEVISADGTRLHAERFGPSDGLPVVLAHGWTENLTYWIHVIRELSGRGLQVVAYDLRGHGRSAGSGDYAIARFGQDLEAVLEAVVPDGQRALIAGHSLGGMSIAAWAQDHDVERRVGAVALLNTGVGELITESLILPVPALARAINESVAVHGFLGSRAPLPRFSSPISHAIIRWVAFGPTASPAQIAFYERMLLAMPPTARADVGIAISEIDLYDALPRLTVPAIVVAGESDRLTPPSHAKRIAEMLPQLERLIILPKTGHMGPLERPREVNQALLELVDRMRSTAAAALS
ncbi:MAG TPA: alpha/beta hydrolase [Solirubrobacteraceae bacterium]|jgi:pimeloyl-ACP methyl ester carboxylesterase